MAEGTEGITKALFGLMRDSSSPSGNIWDVRLLLEEVETQVQARVVDIPQVLIGENNYVRAALNLLATGRSCAIRCSMLTMGGRASTSGSPDVEM